MDEIVRTRLLELVTEIKDYLENSEAGDEIPPEIEVAVQECGLHLNYETIYSRIPGEVHLIFSEKYPDQEIVRVDNVPNSEEYEITGYKRIVSEGDQVEAGQPLAYKELD